MSDPAAEARRFIGSTLGFVPAESRNALQDAFAARLKADRTAALEWMGTVCSILLQDYDDSPLPREDWEELRDILNEGAGEMDLDLLTYAMALVVEHSAI